MTKKPNGKPQGRSSKLALRREVLKRLTRTLDDEQLKGVAGGLTCTSGSGRPTGPSDY